MKTAPAALTSDDMKTIAGGRGVMIDPNGSPSESGSGDQGGVLDPNG